GRLRAWRAINGDSCELARPRPAGYGRAVAQRDVTGRCALAAPDAKVAVQPANSQVAEARDVQVCSSRDLHPQLGAAVERHDGVRELVSWTDTSFASWLMLTRAWLTAHPAAARVIELAECS